MNAEALAPYLTDHLGGASAGIELAQRLQGEAEGTPLAGELAGLLVDIEADRETLERLVTELEIEPSGLKQAAGKVVEKLARARTDRRMTRDATVSRLMELESLVLGIEGKRAMWKALDKLVDLDPRLKAFDFDDLARRAKEQRKRVERYRLAAARDALVADV